MMAKTGNRKSFFQMPLFGLVTILAAVAAVYLNTLQNGFVWDDNVLLVPNTAYRSIDLVTIFTTRVNHLEYLPLRDLSYAIDFQIWGMNPFGFHLSNLLIHLAGLTALYYMVRELVVIAEGNNGDFIAFWTTLFFALHPLNAEVVNFIHGRNTLLAGLFLFLSCSMLLRGMVRNRCWMIGLSLIFFVAAVFSKAIAVFFPLFVAVLIFVILPPRVPSWRWVTMIVTFFFFCISAAAVWVHFVNASAHGVMDTDFIAFGSDNWVMRIARAVQIPFFYLKMFLLPWPLTVEYPVSFLAGSVMIRSVLAGAALFVLAAVAWLLRKRHAMLTLGILWTLTSLLPVLNLFPTSPVVADRYAYFPVFGFCLLTAWGFAWLFRAKKELLLAGAILAAVWSVIVIGRNADWHSDTTLWQSALRVNPGMDRTRLAASLWDEDKYEEALAILKADDERYGSYYYDQYLGRYLALSGRYEEAVAAYARALTRGGDAFREVHRELGQVYEQDGQYLAALGQYLRAKDAASLDPLGKNARLADEGILRMQAVFQPEVKRLREEASERPDDARAAFELALFMQKLGMYDEAKAVYLKMLRIQPSSWEILYNLGILHMKAGDCPEAIQFFERSLSVRPANRDALNNAGVCSMKQKKYTEAAGYYEKALEVDRGFVYAAFNLGRIYFVTGDRDKAKRYFLHARESAPGNEAVAARIGQYLRQMQ